MKKKFLTFCFSLAAMATMAQTVTFVSESHEEFDYYYLEGTNVLSPHFNKNSYLCVNYVTECNDYSDVQNFDIYDTKTLEKVKTVTFKNMLQGMFQDSDGKIETYIPISQTLFNDDDKFEALCTNQCQGAYDWELLNKSVSIVQEDGTVLCTITPELEGSREIWNASVIALNDGSGNYNVLIVLMSGVDKEYPKYHIYKYDKTTNAAISVAKDVNKDKTGALYNILGARVGNNYKGVAVANKKKYIVK